MLVKRDLAWPSIIIVYEPPKKHLKQKKGFKKKEKKRKKDKNDDDKDDAKSCELVCGGSRTFIDEHSQCVKLLAT
jgi:hypothetical protein